MLKRQCQHCQAETSGVVCLADQPGYGGRCPVMDDSPRLSQANQQVASIWEHAQRAANQVQGKDKVQIYSRPETVEALLRLNNVPQDKWADYMRLIAMMDDQANNLRPVRKGR